MSQSILLVGSAETTTKTNTPTCVNDNASLIEIYSYIKTKEMIDATRGSSSGTSTTLRVFKEENAATITTTAAS